jgi:hypothetical protein
MTRISSCGAPVGKRFRNIDSQCPLVKSRNIAELQHVATTRRVGESGRRTRYEQMFSVVHPITDLETAEGLSFALPIRNQFWPPIPTVTPLAPALLRLPRSISNASLSWIQQLFTVGPSLARVELFIQSKSLGFRRRPVRARLA